MPWIVNPDLQLYHVWNNSASCPIWSLLQCTSSPSLGHLFQHSLSTVSEITVDSLFMPHSLQVSLFGSVSPGQTSQRALREQPFWLHQLTFSFLNVPTGQQRALMSQFLYKHGEGRGVTNFQCIPGPFFSPPEHKGEQEMGAPIVWSPSLANYCFCFRRCLWDVML